MSPIGVAPNLVRPEWAPARRANVSDLCGILYPDYPRRPHGGLASTGKAADLKSAWAQALSGFESPALRHHFPARREAWSPLLRRRRTPPTPRFPNSVTGCVTNVGERERK